MSEGSRLRSGGRPLRLAVMAAVGSSFALAMVLILYSYPHAATTINVESKAVVAGDTISLGDIARIGGAEPTLMDRISSVVIGRSPLPGASKSIRGDYISVRLKQSGFDPGLFKISAPETLEVQRDYMELPSDEIKSAIESFILTKRPAAGYELKVKSVSLQSVGPLPKAKLTYHIVPRGDEDFAGAVNVAVDLFLNNRPYRRIHASADVAALADVVVASKPLRAFQRIGDDDIAIQRREISTFAAQIATKGEDVVGKRAKLTVSAGEMILIGMIDTPPLVKRGDLVTIRAESSLISAAAAGKAAENGRKGDIIRVINLSSKKEVSGRVVDSRTVMVDF